MTHLEALAKAEQYQSKMAKIAKKSYWKPQYHISAPANWINDPNGFCYFNGEYHVFYQYHPYSSQWGPMHWGHVASKDLVNWKTKPIALAPTDEYDKDGCFSGSAIEKDNTLYLFYTGHVVLDKENDKDDAQLQTQCVAISEDGISFKKLENNPIINIDSFPEDLNILKEHFRDPKVWKYNDMYYKVVGAQTTEKTGQALIYKSKDLLNWEFVNVMAMSTEEENLGFMWECPNFAEIDNYEVLILSPQGVEPEGNKFLNLHQSGYFLGKMDYNTGIFERENDFEVLDYGFDFYAPQIMQDEKNNRCLMIGWLAMWESEMPEQEEGWAGMMSIPRVLEVKNNKVYSLPIPELKKLRKNNVNYDVNLVQNCILEGINGDCYELNTVFDLTKANGFNLKLRVSENEETVISYDKNSKIFKLNRDKSGKGVTGEREVKVNLQDEKISLQIFSDYSSLEIFINGGEYVISSRIYPTQEATGIVFEPMGEIKAKIDFYEI